MESDTLQLKPQLSEEYRKAIRDYEEFKKIRLQLGKPVQKFADREQIIRDLLGNDSVVVKTDERKKARYFTA